MRKIYIIMNSVIYRQQWFSNFLDSEPLYTLKKTTEDSNMLLFICISIGVIFNIITETLKYTLIYLKYNNNSITG